MTEQQALIHLICQMADDDLVIGHRASEWLGIGPHIEEDIAFASIAQDEVGHATALYKLLEALGEGEADELAFERTPSARRNALLCERPNGPGSFLAQPDWDWAYAVLRHFIYDEFDAVRLSVAAQSSYQPLALLAAKIGREERYHRLHHQTWLKRMASATGEARARLEAALPQVWADLGDLFSLGGLAPSPLFPAGEADLWAAWLERVGPFLTEIGLRPPGDQGAWADWPLPSADMDGRRGEHTPALAALLETMGEVRRTAPGASW
jgi:ring-1,2-phenylacetyl-CoA epoxidase subunit PaaC